ncbi:hypothetical protein D3C84_776800 [compost metagenome]
MAHTGEFDQRGLGNHPGYLFAEDVVVPDLRLDLGWGDVTADGGGVGRSDQQQGRHLQVLEFVIHRLSAGSGNV